MTVYKLTTKEWATNVVVKAFTSWILRVEASQLGKLPPTGPLIVITNHINFLEAPAIYTRMMPRPVTAFSKVETWDSKFLGWLFDVWGIIPIRRGEADKKALKAGLQALKDNYILTISPEGTRSGNGVLQRGLPGIVMMALLSGAPIIPVAHHGHEFYQENLRRLRRSDFKVAVGNPFYLEKGSEKVTSEIRQQMIDEMMYQLAVLLPEEYRGVYANFSQATEKYLRFELPAESNLIGLKLNRE
jgi:1-acyl-sn-glycerol-3-phosphate acyltransferase